MSLLKVICTIIKEFSTKGLPVDHRLNLAPVAAGTPSWCLALPAHTWGLSSFQSLSPRRAQAPLVPGGYFQQLATVAILKLPRRRSLSPARMLTGWPLRNSGGLAGAQRLCERKRLVGAGTAVGWRAGQAGPRPVSGFSQEQSSWELGLPSMSPFYSHLQRWVCLGWASFSAFYGGSSYFGSVWKNHDEDVLWPTGLTHPSPGCEGSSLLRRWASVGGCRALWARVRPRGCQEDGEQCAALWPGQ